MQAILDAPMSSVEQEHLLGRRLGGRKIADPIHRLTAHFAGFEQGGGSVQAKDLGHASPSFGKPFIELRTTHTVSMFQTTMSLVPCLGLRPLPPPGRISEKIGEVSRQRWLIVFGDEDGEALWFGFFEYTREALFLAPIRTSGMRLLFSFLLLSLLEWEHPVESNENIVWEQRM